MPECLVLLLLRFLRLHQVCEFCHDGLGFRLGLGGLDGQFSGFILDVGQAFSGFLGLGSLVFDAPVGVDFLSDEEVDPFLQDLLVDSGLLGGLFEFSEVIEGLLAFLYGPDDAFLGVVDLARQGVDLFVQFLDLVGAAAICGVELVGTLALAFFFGGQPFE